MCLHVAFHKDVRSDHLKSFILFCCLLEHCLSHILSSCHSGLLLLCFLPPVGVFNANYTLRPSQLKNKQTGKFFLTCGMITKCNLLCSKMFTQCFSKILQGLFICVVLCEAFYSNPALLHIWRALMSREGCQDPSRP